MNTCIEKYLDDGANWQAQAVLAYMRGNSYQAIEDSWNPEYREYEAKIYCGRYENCREQGYVFSLRYKTNVRHYAVYEHRNCDSIIILISNQYCINTPSVDTMWAEKGENATKYDYDKAFAYCEVIECGKWIIEDMRQKLSKWVKEESPEEE